MSTILLIFASIGGVVTFLAAVYAILRAGVRQKEAVDNNTRAIEKLTDTLNKLDDRTDNHETRITVLEAGQKWRR